MPEITRVRERRGAARVWVDEEFRAEIDANVALEHGIIEGAVFSEQELEGARIEGERALAMSRAFALISYRSRSVEEIRNRLSQRGHGSDVIERVVERLLELGYLDDEEFARSLARQKARKYGPRRVRDELRRLGLSDETSREVVEEEFSGRSEVEEAREAASRRYNTGERSEAAGRRVYGFLVRRGYSAEVCTEVAREFRADPQED